LSGVFCPAEDFLSVISTFNRFTFPGGCSSTEDIALFSIISIADTPKGV
jgi:hypothetical protein